MHKPNLEEFIESFLTACDFVQEVRVTGDTRFDEMPDFDSLAMLGVIIMMEGEYGRPITADKVFSLGNISALHAYAQGEQ
ncbi:acyl carrier protein [Bordetella holmesii]|uniref:Phosphopantetheine attachment domain protein n=2 Tax=Bordetella holmesii TaxID=35814 RepID=A0A158M560_9BORD|nr:acyl carrier protein [Bordetella holmesii]AHV92955.1 phosphopantetheine attachment site family protein [Bordetella holmesii ATCC 51541]AIT26529.1 phosphopantetheine attachment site family protein [Bordetella holmesii 44057]EWM42944.1 phosphopantetheine attachment site family protein [Bordetella holmesii 41130]EWM47107.1 phosphopantetheine attachment site family protein [Bordetella holmesii 35009]EWM51271.1 phosphopantetheine attachment site family protein [Bordetella holmesii 70147]